jgi:2-oxoglutarate dehydrogenase E2 component (dihydrolipoamide succinyltransferase)
MATVDLIMPKMGESIMEATILKWHKAAGDTIKMDETLLEIATDKVDSEVPSTAEGIVEELLFNVNDVVPIGKVIARVRTGAANSTPKPSPPNMQPAVTQTANQQPAEDYRHTEETTTAQPQTPNPNRFYSPLVLNIAAQEGVSMSELEKMPGTGAEGRVSKKDILQYVSDRKTGKLREPGVKSQEAVGSQHKVQQEMVIPMNKVEQKSEPQQPSLPITPVTWRSLKWTVCAS